MSLLNDMLKDLKSRKQNVQTAVLFKPLQREFNNKLFITLGSVLGLILIGAIFGVIFHTKLLKVMPTPKLLTKAKPVEHHIDKPKAPEIVSDPSAEPSAEKSSEINDFNPNAPLAVNLEESNPKAPFAIKSSLNDVLNESVEALQNGEDPRAIELLSGYLTENPESIEVRENLAAIYLSHREFALGQELLDEGLLLVPYNLRLTTMKARFLVEQGKYQPALTLLKDYHPDINQAPDFYALVAAIYESLGRTHDAGNLYQALTRVDPANGQYWLGLAISLERKHNRQQAIEAYTKASQNGTSLEVSSLAEERLKVLQG